MNTKELIKNTFGTVAVLTIAIFVIVFIAYGYTDVEGQLKETLTITIGVFGGSATLGAAFIAANLFNDWKEQHNVQILANEAINLIRLIHDDIGLIEEVNAEIRDAIYIKNYDLEIMTNILNLGEKIIGSQNNARFSSFNFFYRLTKNNELRNMIDIHSNKVRNISEQLKEMMKHKYDKETCCNLIHSNNLIRAQTDNIFDNLRKYILVE